MRLYAAIDLHSNNSVIVILDENDQMIVQKKLPNDYAQIRAVFAPYQATLEGIAVESTYNWYWLVDSLMADGYSVHLVNTAAVKHYEGLKYTSDVHDARWLAHLLRLQILPCGYVYPKEERALRDLARKRAQLVRQRSTQILSIQNLLARNLGAGAKSTAIKRYRVEDIEAMPLLPEQRLALKSNLLVMQCLDAQIEVLEKAILAQTKLRKDFQSLLTVSGIGKILALTIALETGDITRFGKVGNFASYARCVDSKRLSNHKKKGEGNAKNGNRYLAWAFIEAANFAVRYDEVIKRFYQKKRAKTNGIVAIKTVAHKLARACYHILHDGSVFESTKAFA